MPGTASYSNIRIPSKMTRAVPIVLPRRDAPSRMGQIPVLVPVVVMKSRTRNQASPIDPGRSQGWSGLRLQWSEHVAAQGYAQECSLEVSGPLSVPGLRGHEPRHRGALLGQVLLRTFYRRHRLCTLRCRWLGTYSIPDIISCA